VTAVGAPVTQFDIGEEVFGAHKGAFAEYVAVPESAGVVTTSREGVEPGIDRLAGSLFQVVVGVIGLPVREFAG
jgi:NADPH:quinone reductase-like Zn-dependent oxidoreductase